MRGARGRESDGPTFRAVYAPYWVFDVSAETQCEGAVEVEELGAKRDGRAGAIRRFEDGESNMREFRAQEGFRGRDATGGARGF